MADSETTGVGGDRYDRLIERGIAHLELDDLNGLADLCADAVRENAARPEAYTILGVLSFMLDDFGRSIELLTKAHDIDPNIKEIPDILAHVHTRAGNLNDGVYFAKLAGTGESNPLLARINVAGLNDFASALDEAEEKSYAELAARALIERRFADAIAACEKELRLRSGNAELFLVLSGAFAGLGEFQKATDACHAAMHLEPGSPRTHLALARVLSHLGQPTRASSSLCRAVQLGGGDRDVIGKAAATAAPLFPKSGLGGIEAVWKAPMRRKPVFASPAGGTYHRVGYLTDSVSSVDEMRIVETILKGHDRDRLAIAVYSADIPNDTMPSRFQSLAARWRNISGMDDGAIVERMFEDELDFLVDLTFQRDGQRPGVLAASPARFVLGAYGPKPGLLGAGYDRLLVSRSTAVGDENELAVDGPLLSVDPATMPSAGGETPFMERGYTTFGATLDLRHLTPDVAATFAEVLRAVPNARLLLGNRDVIPPTVENRAMEYFADHGVVDRVDIEPLDQTGDQTLVVKRMMFMVSIDAYLASFPVHDLLSPLDAMASGVPVVSMRGRNIDGMSAPGLLHAAGLDDYLADNADGFVAAAFRAAEATSKTGYRKTAIDNIQASPVFDRRAVSLSFEEIFDRLNPLDG